MAIQKGDTITVHYTGKLDDGTVFDSSEGKEPLTFEVGSGQLIKGFDNAVIGMNEGESKEVKIPPTEAYGERREELSQSIPRDKAPEGIQAGMQVMMQAPNGMNIPATIAEVTDEEVKVDLNHPLAGKDLTFNISVENIGAKK